MFTHALAVRFRDLDAMNHVNNAVYLTYLEEARLAFSRVMGVDWARFREQGFVLARCEIDYRLPAVLGDVLRIGLQVGRVGRSSFDFLYRIQRDSDGRLIAEAKTVQVCYDYRAQRPMRIPADWRPVLLQHQADGAETAADLVH